MSDKKSGGGDLETGHDNELWSYGEEAFSIMKEQLQTRWALKPYLIRLYQEAQETGAPLMRPMFWGYETDPVCWTLTDQYLFGPDYLVAPILTAGARSRSVYLPEGTWEEIRTKKHIKGGQWIQAEAPIEAIPVYRCVR